MSKIGIFQSMLQKSAFLGLFLCHLLLAQFNANVFGQANGGPTLYDFDGDRKADLSVFRRETGEWWFLRSSDGTYSPTNFGLMTDQPVADDYDGDGKTDFGVYRDGVWYRLKTRTATVDVISFGLPDDIPVPADFDGDRNSDLAVFRPSNGTWHRLNSSDGQYSVRQWGGNSDIPLPGDYDGDGKADANVFRPTEGNWYRVNSADGSTLVSRFGINGDIPLSGDFDGDRKFDLAVWRPATSAWYVLNSSAGTVVTQSFGLATDVPVPADYDGDGKHDVAVFRPSNSVWYRINSRTDSFEWRQFGFSTDNPLPARRTRNSSLNANNDTFSTPEDTQLTIPAAGVLSNDTGGNGNPLTAVLVSGTSSAQGTVSLNTNGSFTFTPTANFNGAATFTYRATDGARTSNNATVTINVVPVNDPPVAVNDTYSATGGMLNTPAPGVLSNDGDIDGNPLTAVLVTAPAAAQGTLTLNANGSFAFAAAPGFSGPATFTYRASDGTLTSGIATVTINVAPVASFTCDYYASTTGSSSGTGTNASPWNLPTALSKTSLIQNGKTLCLKGGTYRGKFFSSLRGGGIVRSAPGEWAVIDGNARTTTTNAVSSTQSSVVLASTENLVPGSKFAVDNEIMFVESISGSTVNVIRGWDGTAASAHLSNAPVVHAGQQLLVQGDTTTYRDFEITNSGTDRDAGGECCGFKAIIRGAGLVQNTGTGNSYINLIVHDNWDGIFTGSSTSNTTIYGCVSYNNGGNNPPSGHGLYLENSAGYSRIYETMSLNNFNLGIQAYGVTGAYVGGDLQGCIVSGSGLPVSARHYNLIYGPDSVMSPTGIVNECHFYHAPNTNSYSVKFGYGAGVVSGTVTNNYFHGSGTAFEAGNVTNLTFTGNKFYSTGTNDSYAFSRRLPYNWNNNTYYNTTNSQASRFADTSIGERLTFANWKSTMGFDASSVATSSAMPDTVIVRPSSYTAGRANVIIYSRPGVTSIAVNLSSAGLLNGQTYTIRNAFNYTGPAVLTGTYNSSSPTVNVPLNTAAATVAAPYGVATAPPTTCPNFCALIVVPN